MTSSYGNRADGANDDRGITRYWCQRDASVPLAEGYLALHTFGMRSPALHTIDELAELQAVALVGERGLGKTTTLNAYEQRARADAGEEVVRFDLADYGSDSLLVTDIFDDLRLQRWRGGKGELRLLLDSFDECKARIPNLGGILASRLRRCPVERLRLMIVCRTADWPLSLEAELHAIFGEVGVYELLPLQRDDVRAIAEQAGLDGDGFLAAVEHSGVTALASRPLTLKLLLGRFQQSGVRCRTAKRSSTKRAWHGCATSRTCRGTMRA
jgi:hypothetical protein